jgi:hypothetical protein
MPPESADITLKLPLTRELYNGPAGFHLGAQPCGQISLKAPYFLPSFHQFCKVNLGFALDDFVNKVEDFAAKLANRDPSWNRPGEYYGNPIDLVVRLYVADDLGRKAFLKFLRCYATNGESLYLWFKAALPRLAEIYKHRDLSEWIHGWNNFYHLLDRGNPFDSISEDEYDVLMETAYAKPHTEY